MNHYCTHNSQKVRIEGKLSGGGIVFDYTAQAKRVDGVVNFDVAGMEKTFFLLNGFYPSAILYKATCIECATERTDTK